MRAEFSVIEDEIDVEEMSQGPGEGWELVDVVKEMDGGRVTKVKFLWRESESA